GGHLLSDVLVVAFGHILVWLFVSLRQSLPHGSNFAHTALSFNTLGFDLSHLVSDEEMVAVLRREFLFFGLRGGARGLFGSRFLINLDLATTNCDWRGSRG